MVNFGILRKGSTNNVLTFSAADQTQTMQDQMSGAASSMPQDSKAAFKAEWEALEITEYNFVLQNVEAELCARENINGGGQTAHQNNIK